MFSFTWALCSPKTVAVKESPSFCVPGDSSRQYNFVRARGCAPPRLWPGQTCTFQIPILGLIKDQPDWSMTATSSHTAVVFPNKISPNLSPDLFFFSRGNKHTGRKRGSWPLWAVRVLRSDQKLEVQSLYLVVSKSSQGRWRDLPKSTES